MKLLIDTETNELACDGEVCPLYSDEGFDKLSCLWLKVGWNARYHYTFTWMGRPILQLPQDAFRLQEIIFDVKPEVIIETGVAMGGSTLFYATLCQAMGLGRVIAIDKDLRPPNRRAIEAHPLSKWVTLIEGDSTAPETVAQLPVGKRGLVILDANHSKAHVARELELYHPYVAEGSYLVVADGFKRELVDVPRGKEAWSWDHPVAAVENFLERHPEFESVQPPRRYSRSQTQEVSHFLEGWLRKRPAQERQPAP